MGQDLPNPQSQPATEEKERKGHYEGECDDLGRPHGKGEMFYASDQSFFKGQFNAGRRHHGKLTLKNSDYYEGYFNEKNEPHGEGVWKEGSNGTFKGIFS